IRTENGTEKLLYRLWRTYGLEGVRAVAAWPQRTQRRPAGEPAALVTGGGGFVGANLAHRLLSEGQHVVIYDNLSRAGVEENVNWLLDNHGDRVQLVVGDVRDRFT